MPYTTVQAKSIFMSTTFYGSILALISAIDPALYAKLLSSLGVTDPSLITAKIITVVAFIITVYGRWTTVQPVALKAGPKVMEVEATPTGMKSFPIPPAK
jgi:hypothetical protein